MNDYQKSNIDIPEQKISISAAQMDELVHTLTSTMVERDGLRNILETMLNAVIIVSATGFIMHVNHAAHQLLDCLSDEMINKPIEKIIGKASSCWEDCLIELRHQGAIRNREVLFKSWSNRDIPVLFSASIQRTHNNDIAGIVCCAQDISEHIRLREALQSSQENFQAIVDKSIDGILIIDWERNVCFANPAAEHLLGRSCQEMMGMQFGYPLVDDEVTELDIIRKNGELGIAEMRSSETEWHGKQSLLVSLRDVTENVRLREQLQQLSMEDPLTGLNNRRGFMMLASQEMKMAERGYNRMAMIFIDLDGMKTINDTFGHEIGDHALLETASILRKVFRKSDLLARQGGDEFIALFIDKKSDDVEWDISQLVQRLEQETAYHNAQLGRLYTLSLSIGVVPIDLNLHSDIEYYIKQADVAMYQTKLAKKLPRHHR